MDVKREPFSKTEFDRIQKNCNIKTHNIFSFLSNALNYKKKIHSRIVLKFFVNQDLDKFDSLFKDFIIRLVTVLHI